MFFNKKVINNIKNSTLNSWNDVEINNQWNNQWKHNIYSNNNLPPAPYIDFIWREKEIEQISWIIEYRNTYILSIEWIGWLWKTSIAHYVAKKLLDENKVWYVIWCSAKNKDINENVEDIKQYFYDLESFLDISLNVLWQNNLNLYLKDKQEILKKEVSEKWKEKTILFILDNFETIKDQNLIDFIDSFMYSAWKHFFLFTSRIRSWLKDRPLEIWWLSENNLVKVAKSYVIKFWIKNINDADIHELAKKAKWNPLVIRVCIVRMETRKPKEVIRVLDNPNWSKIYQDIANYLFLEIFNDLSNEAKVILYILNYIWNQDKTNKYSDFEIWIIREVMNEELVELWKDLKDIFDEINKSWLLHITFNISKNDSIDSITYEEFLTIFLQKMKEDDIEIQKKLKNFEIQYKTKRNTHSIENQKYEKNAKDLWAKNQNEIICYKECSKAITNLNKYHKKKHESTKIFLEQSKNFIDIAETFSKDFSYLNYTKWYYYLKEWNFEKWKNFFSKIVDSFKEWRTESKKLYFIKNYFELLVRNADNDEALTFILQNINILKSSDWTIKEQIKRSLNHLENSYRNQKNFEKVDEIKELVNNL